MSIRNYIPGTLAIALFVVLAVVMFSATNGTFAAPHGGLEGPVVISGLP
ncbi:MAG: hypothetical protein ACOY33_10450 [Pseudomonadota bacterium]